MKINLKTIMAAMLFMLPFISKAQTWNTAGNSNCNGLEKLGFISPASCDLKIYTNGQQNMTITNGGNVGIGNSFTPKTKLDVQGIVTLNNYELRLRDGLDGNHGLKYDATVNGPYLFGYAGGALGTAGYSPSLTWDNNGRVSVRSQLMVDNAGTNSGTIENTLRFGGTGTGEAIGSKRTSGGNQYGLDFWAGNSIRVSISNSGKVGIGTTSPENMLHIFKGSAGVVAASANSPLVVESSGNCYAQFLTPDTYERGVFFGDNVNSFDAGIVYNNLALTDGLQFRTNGNVTRMSIDASGKVGIGTGTGAPAAMLHIKPVNAVALRIDPFGTANGNTGELRFQELTANGSNYTALKAPSNLSNDVIFTLPSSNGSNGQVLTSNGSGNLSWSTIVGDGDPFMKFGYASNGQVNNLGITGPDLFIGGDEASDNTFVGINAGGGSFFGSDNSFFGALIASTNEDQWEGYGNSFFGSHSAFEFMYGDGNSFFGHSAGYNTTAAGTNTFIGDFSGYSNINGSGNTLLGASTDVVGTISNATAIGKGATVTASNIFILGNTDVIGWGFGVHPYNKALKVGTNATNGNGAYLTFGGAWTSTSARSKKENFQHVDKNKILEKIDQLEVTKWKYKGTENEYHYGPMADDFHRLFEVGDDSSIADMDKTGILFLGLQAVIDENRELKIAKENLEKRITLLENQAQTTDGIVKVSQDATANSALLGQNIPNPFDNTTVIPFRIPKGCTSASIVITESATGRIVTAIPVSCDETHAVIEAGSLSSGTYQYTLYIDGKPFDTRQMVLTK